ncbi:MAG TPA: 50S ribosomal protein L25 [Spirochaetales bacterium]|nr:50S ribosomal protein L25 [Spirochaetia bacterium]HPE36691.1 50S ribosomal protein L25 [Spirochaetales bacterium]
MSQHVLNAGVRAVSTKGDVKALRRQGKIPAVMYNRHGKIVHLTLDTAEFAKATKGVSESTIVKLEVGADSYQCMIKDRQLNWLRGTIEHVDFFEVESGVAIRAKVSIHLIGTPVGVREGGVLENPVHEIEVECLPNDMPEKFEIDVSGLQANHSVHVRDINHAPAVKILSSLDQVVALVKFARTEAEPVAAETAEAPEAEAAAAPAAAPAAEK